MDNPSSYISFADYMGLNDEAGQAMLKRTMEQGDKLRTEANAATDARFSAAKGGAEAYAASGERERKGLASYADFAKGLQDPVARQALMEKVYGRGAVSALDSALTGGASGGGLQQAQKDFSDTQRHSEEAGIRNDGRAAMYEKQRTGYEQQAKDYAASQAGKRAELAKVREVNANREDWRAYNYEMWKKSGGDANHPYAGAGPAPDQDFQIKTGGHGFIDPTTKKAYTVKKAKQLTGAYGWGGAGTLRDAQGGGDY